jgi:hypothetical protein
VRARGFGGLVTIARILNARRDRRTILLGF